MSILFFFLNDPPPPKSSPFPHPAVSPFPPPPPPPAHPPRLAPRRDQAQLGPPVADPDQRRPAARGVGAAAHVVRAQAGLVAPEDHAPGPLGPRHDGRVVPPQPAPHRRRVLDRQSVVQGKSVDLGGRRI